MQNIPWKDLVEPIIALVAIGKAIHSGSQASKAKESVEAVKSAREVSTKERDTQLEVMEEKIKHIEVSYKKGYRCFERRINFTFLRIKRSTRITNRCPFRHKGG